MWKDRKRGLPLKKAGLFLILTLSFLTGSMPVSADDTAYRTATVKRGTLEVEATAKIIFTHNRIVPVILESKYGTVKFVSYAVSEGTFVDKGDPIINVQTSVDEIALEEVKLRYERLKKSCDKEFADMQEQHEAAKKAVAGSSGTQKQIAQLRLEQLEMEQGRYKLQLEESLAKVQEELDAYEELKGMTQIVAQESGNIMRLSYMGEGAVIGDGTEIARISTWDEMMFMVVGGANVLRYGMKVTIKDGMGSTYSSTVISSGEKYLSSTLRTADAYLKPESADSWGLDAIYKNIEINNVLLVDSAAVRRDRDGDYVVELKDGELIKRYITIGKAVNNLCYAVDGLTEGMTVVIQ